MATKKVGVKDEASWQEPVINIITDATRGGLSPAKGDRYLLSDGANINKICYYADASWIYLTAVEGWIVWNNNDNLFYKFDGTNWSIEIGATGTTGAIGTTGAVGTTGAEGADGTTGVQGTTGITGTTGAAGNISGQLLYFDNIDSDLITPTIVSNSTIAFVTASTPDTMTRADAGSFITDGFQAGQKIKISGGANNGYIYTILVVAATTITFIHSTTVINESAGTAITITVQREKLTRVPVSGIQVTETVSVQNDSPENTVGVAIDSYSTLSTVPGVTEIPGGVWDFHFWAYLNVADNGFIHFKVLKINTLGIETSLFDTGKAEITSVAGDTDNQKYYTLSYAVSSPVSLLTTDRIIIRPIATTTSPSKTVSFIYQGTAMASHIATTFNVSAPMGTTGAIGTTGAVGTTGAAPTITYSRSFVISNPTSSSDLPIWRVPANITITAIHLLCHGAAIVGQLWEYDANGLNGATVDSSDITGVVDTNVNDDGTLSNPSIDAGDYLGWKTTSATVGATYAIVTFDYTIN
jgi:hypothetical protein